MFIFVTRFMGNRRNTNDTFSDTSASIRARHKVAEFRYRLHALRLTASEYHFFLLGLQPFVNRLILIQVINADSSVVTDTLIDLLHNLSRRHITSNTYPFSFEPSTRS
jgi:hypothetical protein